MAFISQLSDVYTPYPSVHRLIATIVLALPKQLLRAW